MGHASPERASHDSPEEVSSWNPGTGETYVSEWLLPALPGGVLHRAAVAEQGEVRDEGARRTGS